MRNDGRPTIALADDVDREAIFRLRHDVYATELGQHAENAEGRLSDALDGSNVYVVARAGGRVVGCVSLTPPGAPRFSVEKYVARGELPFAFDDGLFEIRLLTVDAAHRGGLAALALMYAAVRWAEDHGGRAIVAIGRVALLPMYRSGGLRPVGRRVVSGRVEFEVMHAPIAEVRAEADARGPVFARLERGVDWRLPVPFRPPAGCFHGGAFFDAIGDDLRDLGRRHAVVNADVLDAWFDPAPGVLKALGEHLPWALRTSPPTDCAGLVRTIAEVRGVPAACVLPGAGSSDLIFRALPRGLGPGSRALLLDPTYGEYAHVLERIVGCGVARFPLRREDGYAPNLARLAARLARGFDVAVLVNPNSPTGAHVPRESLERLIGSAPRTTRFWIDETYVDYAGPGQSLERFASGRPNVIVCKSMSKVYALSGARCAYLVGAPATIEPLRDLTPPWAVGLPGQIAAVEALRDPAYYAARWRETHALRASLAAELARTLGWDVVPGVANFLLVHLPPDGPDAAAWVAAARERGVFLRDASRMGRRLGRHALRLAVKDAVQNERIVATLRAVAKSMPARAEESE